MAKLWDYSDWITQTDQTIRLTRLRLHIEEVSQHIVGSSGRNSSKFPPDPKYLQSLKDDEKQLSSVVETTGVGKVNAPIGRIRTRQRRV